MKQKDIIDAWAHIRKIDNTIPDDVLNFMKDAAISALNKPDSLSSLLTVIVPPIEWEQDPEDQRWWYGKDRDGKYSLKIFGNKIIAYYGSETLFVEFVELNNSMDDAKAVCQKHKQAIVDAALEGCNVVPYRDMQSLWDVVIEHLEQIANGRRQQEGINATLLMVKANFRR